MILRKGRVVDKYHFHFDGVPIPPMSEKTMKSLWNDLTDSTAVQLMHTELKTWLLEVDNSGIPGKFKTWIHQRVPVQEARPA